MEGAESEELAEVSRHLAAGATVSALLASAETDANMPNVVVNLKGASTEMLGPRFTIL